MIDKNKLLPATSFDTPVPFILPNYKNQSVTKVPALPTQRNSVQHGQTSPNIPPFAPKTETQNSLKKASVSECNCGVNTGNVYTFSIKYNKNESIVNKNTNQKRRDWLYIEFRGNIDTSSVKNNKLLIYFK